eukprot:10195771-Alexandrium_andersonii.AAC.1
MRAPRQDAHLITCALPIARELTRTAHAALPPRQASAQGGRTTRRSVKGSTQSCPPQTGRACTSARP